MLNPTGKPMTASSPLRLYGTHASPYTRKMLSLLRYRRIPYQLLQGGPGGAPRGFPKPKVELLPTFYIHDEEGELQALVDSTPLIRQLEESTQCRPVIPEDPALRFIDYLLEDYGDEWLTKAMFHYRWAYQADRDKAAVILPLEHRPALAEDQRQALQRAFCDRQVSRLHVVGSNELTGEVIENSYRQFLHAFESILRERPFLFGERPGASDFAFYGQLSQLAAFDPTPMQLTLETAPRVCGWVNYMEDLSGLEVNQSGWMERDQLRDSLKPLLEAVGHSYVPVMLANARALSCGEDLVETIVNGKKWQQQTFPYQRRCLQWLREHYQSLPDGDRQWVDALLLGTACDALFED